MTHSPLDNPDRIAPLHGCRRAGATWLALVALLGNILLPAALSILVLNEPGRDIHLCRQWPGDAPGKARPGLLVQHCPFCTVPAAPLARLPSILVPGEVAKEIQLRLPTTVSIAPIRHGRMQARAPPSVG
jgi:hypothetical protein